MFSIYGYKIVISPLIKDQPKIKFGLFESNQKVQEFNSWLEEMFGLEATGYLVKGDTMLVSASTYDAMKKEARGDKKC